MSIIAAGCSQNTKIIDATGSHSVLWKDDIELIAKHHGLSHARTNFMMSVVIPLKDVDLVREFHHLREAYPEIYHNIEMHTVLNENNMTIDWFPSSL